MAASQHEGVQLVERAIQGSPSRPIPTVLIAQEGGVGFSVSQLCLREVCNGDRGGSIK